MKELYKQRIVARDYDFPQIKNMQPAFEDYIPDLVRRGETEKAFALYISQSHYTFGYFLRLVTDGLRRRNNCRK